MYIFTYPCSLHQKWTLLCKWTGVFNIQFKGNGQMSLLFLVNSHLQPEGTELVLPEFPAQLDAETEISSSTSCKEEINTH